MTGTVYLVGSGPLGPPTSFFGEGNLRLRLFDFKFLVIYVKLIFIN